MEIKFEKYISGDQVERINQDIDETEIDELVLHMSNLQDARLFANARLSSLLFKCATKGITVVVKIGENLKPYSASNKNWNFFIDTVLGILLIHYADKVLEPSGKDVKTEIKHYQYSFLASNKCMVGMDSGHEKCAVSIAGFNTPERAEIFKNTDRESYDLTKFYNYFSKMLYQINGYRNSSLVELICSNIGSEALQNVNDHAIEDLKLNLINQVQFIDVRRVTINGWTSQFENFYEKESSDAPVTMYLKALKQYLNYDDQNFNELFLVEITISDCGVGIPAKITRNPRIYESDIELEVEALEKALMPYETSKTNNIGAGFGLPKMLAATNRANGIIVFRTGRLCMYKSYLLENEKSERQLSFWDAEQKNYLPGTSISILFPWTKLNINQQTLF